MRKQGEENKRLWKQKTLSAVVGAALVTGSLQPATVWAMESGNRQLAVQMQTQDQEVQTEEPTGANSGKCGVNATYTLSGGTLTISGTGVLDSNTTSNPLFPSSAQVTHIVIKSGITGIGQSDFKDFTNLTSVELASTVKSIGDIAFKGCTSLSEITIPSSVTSLGYQSFMNCTKLKSVKIPSSVTTMKKGVFTGCTGLNSATVASKNSGEETFYGCSSLATVTFASGAQEIAQNVCKDCGGLTKIVIGPTVTNISTSAFLNLANISTMEVDSANQNYQTDNGYLYKTADQNVTLQWCPSTTTTLKPKDGTTAIGANACRICEKLTKVTLPSSVKKIGGYAFQECSKLSSITIPDGLEEIGTCAFKKCSSLSSVNLPDSITKIEQHVFYGCTSLTSVKLPSQLSQLDPSLFQECTGLTSVTLPNALTVIGDRAFYGCSKLKNVTFPDGLGEIGKYAFFGCDALKCVTFSRSIYKVWNHALGFYGADENSPQRYSDFKVFCYQSTEGETYAKQYGLTYDNTMSDHTHCFEVSGTTYTCKTCGLQYKAGAGTITQPSSTKVSSQPSVNPSVSSQPSRSTSVSSQPSSNTPVSSQPSRSASVSSQPSISTSVSSQPSSNTPVSNQPSSSTSVSSQPSSSTPVSSQPSSEPQKQNQKASPGKNGIRYDGNRSYVVYAPSRLILSQSLYVFNNKDRKPTLRVRDANGNDIASEHYTIQYKDNKNVGTATVTVTFQGESYEGQLKTTFTIRPKTTALSSLTALKGAVKVKWKKTTSELTGYQVQYALNAKFTGSHTVKVKGVSVKQKKLTGLKKKKYYVRIRVYKTVQGKTYYSDWSASKKVTTKS